VLSERMCHRQDAARVAPSSPGLYLLYDRAGRLLHVWHAVDVRSAMSVVFGGFSNPLRDTAFVDFRSCNAQQGLFWSNYYIDKLRPITQS